MVLQINLMDITKRPLRLAAHLETEEIIGGSTSLKLIGEELWLSHDAGITVYDSQWNKLREIRFGDITMSVAALDTKTVVIATRKSLVISSTAGMNIQVVDICIFCRIYIAWLKKIVLYVDAHF